MHILDTDEFANSAPSNYSSYNSRQRLSVNNANPIPTITRAGTCPEVVLVGADVSFMLMSTDRFLAFSERPLKDARRTTSALYAIGVESREAVSAAVTRALNSGARPAADPKDHGYMYAWSFYDPNGHQFEVFWIDSAPFPARSNKNISASGPRHDDPLK